MIKHLYRISSINKINEKTNYGNTKKEAEKILKKFSVKNKSQVSKNSDKKLLDAISDTINLLDSGKLRVAEKKIING